MNIKRMLAVFLTVSVLAAAASIFAEGSVSGPEPDAADLPGAVTADAEPESMISPPEAAEPVDGGDTYGKAGAVNVGDVESADGGDTYGKAGAVNGDAEPVDGGDAYGKPETVNSGDGEPVDGGDTYWTPEAVDGGNTSARTEPAPADMPEASTVAGPDDGGNRPEQPLTKTEQRDAQKRERLAGGALESAEPLSEITFEQVEGRTREDNMTVRAMRESVTGLEGIDYEQSSDDLLKVLNGLSAQQELLSLMPSNEPLAQTFAISSLQSQYDSLYTTFEQLNDGTTRRNSRDAIQQLTNAMDQVVMGSETLYIALIAMRDQRTALNRQLESLNRTVEEMELRYSLGQISALALNQVKSGRTALQSGIQTLEMNIRTYKMQLENMLGAGLTGEIELGELPAVTEAQIAALDAERDFSAANEKSYELYAAARTLQDARETFLSSAEQYRYNESNSSYKMAQHTWTAAQDTYNVTVRGYELKFRTLSEQVHDYYQVLNASKEALEAQKMEYQSKELQYKQGNLSKNALLTAEDAVREKEEAVRTASNNLFSSYNNYCWAVQTGILN